MQASSFIIFFAIICSPPKLSLFISMIIIYLLAMTINYFMSKAVNIYSHDYFHYYKLVHDKFFISKTSH